MVSGEWWADEQRRGRTATGNGEQQSANRGVTWADFWARQGFQPSSCWSIQRRCMLYVPLTTRSTVWYHCSLLPSGRVRE